MVVLFYIRLLSTNFVSLKRLNRIRTTTNQEKGVFIFIIFLIVPLFLMTSGISFNFMSGYHNLEVNSGDSNGNSAYHSGNTTGSKNTCLY